MKDWHWETWVIYAMCGICLAGSVIGLGMVVHHEGRKQGQAECMEEKR